MCCKCVCYSVRVCKHFLPLTCGRHYTAAASRRGNCNSSYRCTNAFPQCQSPWLSNRKTLNTELVSEESTITHMHAINKVQLRTHIHVSAFIKKLHQGIQTSLAKSVLSSTTLTFCTADNRSTLISVLKWEQTVKLDSCATVSKLQPLYEMKWGSYQRHRSLFWPPASFTCCSPDASIRAKVWAPWRHQ